MTTECFPEKLLNAKRATDHAHCFACGMHAEHGMHLKCHTDPDGRAIATFQPRPWMISYAGRLHGGLVATVLDSAMTQCLFAHGVSAVTAQLQIRYRHPAPADRPLTVTAWIDDHRHTLYTMHATLSDGQRIVARGEAIFVALPDAPVRKDQQ